MNNFTQTRKYTNKLLKAMDEGIMDLRTVAEMAIGWLSDDDVKDMCHANDIRLDNEDEVDTTSYVKIKFLPASMMAGMYRADDGEHASDALAAGLYVEESSEFVVTGEGKEAAEEVFDLTNNPSRQDEREQVYGNGRSLSVGDIVIVGTEMWLCKAAGWGKLS